MSKISTEKVIAYITQANQLLVFSHPHHPEAGIQVPAGTIQAGESPEEAVLREAYEETGLENLELQAFLGVQEFDITQFGRAEVQRRYFFHLQYHGEPKAIWRHYENYPSEGSTKPIEFELFWVEFPHGVPKLIAGHGALLSRVQIKD